MRFGFIGETLLAGWLAGQFGVSSYIFRTVAGSEEAVNVSGAQRSLAGDGKGQAFSFAERDRSLLKGKWPNAKSISDDEWKCSKVGAAKTLTRTLAVERHGSKPVLLTETLLRFPSAPIHAVHRAPEPPFKIQGEWPNYHTIRVIQKHGKANRPARNIFLLHNGLNETREMSFHHRMAAWILQERKDAACIIRPLPNHLTRYPFQGPASEQPLDEFLRDPVQVYRQFMRYMVETRWLLSILAPRNDYEVSTGCELLLDHEEPGREDTKALAERIASEANRAVKASKKMLKEKGAGVRSGGGRSFKKVDSTVVEESISTLRTLVGWQEMGKDTPSETKADRPALHVVGYSMGGFFAQSIFCTWPFAISSCSNLFAGGAIRDLAPTAFAHPEEWQTVLHGLRYELDEARAEGYFTPLDDDYKEIETPSPDAKEYVFGIDKETFEYLNRVFEDVFLQTDRGGYSTRLEEFGRRMLFILGGDDPIVRTRNVLDAAPPGGVTMHQIGDVTHFPGNQGAPAETAQRRYWLPEAGRMIGRFAERQASATLQEINSRAWGGLGYRKPPGEEVPEMPIPVPPDRALSNMLFEQELDKMIAEVAEGNSGGWLFIARNQIPTVFLGSEAIKSHATAMHHSEDLIQIYADRLLNRAKALRNPPELRDSKPRFTLLIPSAQRLEEAGQDGPHLDRASERAKFSKSETAYRHWPNSKESKETWTNFVETWCAEGQVRMVEQGEHKRSDLKPIGPAWAKGRLASKGKIAVTMLPDVWFAVGWDFLNKLKAWDREPIGDALVEFAARLADKGEGDAAREELSDLMKRGEFRMIKVSAAEFNPRFRGRLLDSASDSDAASKLLINWALAYRASEKIVGSADSEAD